MRDAGFEEDKAEAVAEAFKEDQSESLPVTRDYLDARFNDSDLQKAPILAGLFCI